MEIYIICWLLILQKIYKDKLEEQNNLGNVVEETIFTAIQSGNLAAVRLYIEQGANLDERNQYNSTPLHEAIYNNQLSIAQLILDCGANVEAKGYGGSTPMHYAAKQNNLAALILLVQSRAKIDSRNEYGRTPLHLSAKSNAIIALLYLIEQGANINAKDNKDRTPLHMAEREGSSDAKFLLCLLQADETARDIEGQTPPEVGKRHKNSRKAKAIKCIDKNEQNYLEVKLQHHAYLIKTALLVNQQGIEHYHKQSYKEAARKFTFSKALFNLASEAKDDNLARLLYNLGSTYMKIGQRQKAKEYLQKALYIKLLLHGKNHPFTLKYKARLIACLSLFDKPSSLFFTLVNSQLADAESISTISKHKNMAIIPYAPTPFLGFFVKSTHKTGELNKEAPKEAANSSLSSCLILK